MAIALATLVILALTLMPGSDPEAAGWLSCWVCGRRGTADIILNVLLFVPFGAALRVAGARWWQVWLAGAVLSAGIEYAQLFIPGRDSSLADIVSNSTGALAGAALALVLARTVDARRPPAWQAFASSASVVGLIALGGLLLRPSFPHSTYFGEWTPDLGRYVWYRGRVLAASIGGVPLPSDRLAESDRVRTLLTAGTPLRLRALAGPSVPRLAVLFSMADDRHRELFLAGPDRDDLVFRYRPRAAAWRLDRPALRYPGAMRGRHAGDTLDITFRPDGKAYCVKINTAESCTIGFTVGAGWGLLLYIDSLAPWLRVFAGVVWVAALFVPVGFWSASRRGVAVGLVVGIVGLAAVAPAAGLVATPAAEWGGAALGLAVGLAARELVVRRQRALHSAAAPASDPSKRTSSPKQRSILA